MTFIDGTPKTCRCTAACEWPCAHREGLTAHPCCPGCGPLPEPIENDEDTP